MSMEIKNSYGNYVANYSAANGIPPKADTVEKSSEKTTSAKDKVAEYYSNLQKKYECVRDGKVSISGSYLKECANDPQKAQQPEADLAFYKESYESGRKSAEVNLRALGDTLVSYEETWSYDSKGNLTMIAQTQGTAETGTKDWKELREEQEKKLKERREKERIEEKKKAKKTEEKKIAAKKAQDKKAQEKSAETQKEKTIAASSQMQPDHFYRPGIDVSI